MNTTTVSGIKLKVSISRNQPIEFGDKGVTPWNAIGKILIINLIIMIQNIFYYILCCILYNIIDVPIVFFF